jgi:hypothetical protein
MLICVVLEWHHCAALYSANYLVEVTNIFLTSNICSYQVECNNFEVISLKTFWFYILVCQSAILTATLQQAFYYIEFCITYKPLLLCFSGQWQKVISRCMNLLGGHIQGLCNVRNHIPGIVLHLIDSVLSQRNVFDNSEAF